MGSANFDGGGSQQPVAAEEPLCSSPLNWSVDMTFIVKLARAIYFMGVFP